MKGRTWFLFLAIQILICAATFTPAQQADDEEARGKFISTRPKAPPSQKTSKVTGPPAVADSHPVSTDVPPAKPGAIQVGYTLYERSARGTPLRVDPNRVFHEKDTLRLVVEPNSDGYLYVFTTADNEKATMLFPNERLSHGDNRALAHVPYEIPSGLEPKESDRWFVFDEKPAVERLYVVFTRQPLPNVLSGEKLLSFCSKLSEGQSKKQDCAWEPSSVTWDRIVADAKAPKSESTIRADGQALSESEALASSRHIGLTKSDPEPWILKTNADPKSDTLTVLVALTHK